MSDDAEMEKVIDRVRKLLSLANRNTSAEESASAAAKAQALLTAYNLDLSTVEQSDGTSGKREDARVRGGMYVYERELWEAVAKLNFCWYFPTREYTRDSKGRTRTTFQHRLIGRTVNTASTRVLGNYLQGAIERLCNERFPENTQRFTREAVSYREGAADSVIHRLHERRQSMLKAEAVAAKKAEADMVRAAKAGVSTATGLTVASLAKSEYVANYDYMHGDGAYARMLAEKEQRKKDSEAYWAERAKADAEAEAAYTLWAAANPKEAAKEQAKERSRERAKERRQASAGRSYRYTSPTAREQRASSGYYQSGYEKGSAISLETQVDKAAPKRLR